MRFIEATVAALLMAGPALAADDDCPQGLSNDDCNAWLVHRMDARLAEAVAARIEKNAKLTTYAPVSAEIRRTGQAAHIAWLAFREAECNAQVAAAVMSARPAQQRKAFCILALAEARLAEISKP